MSDAGSGPAPALQPARDPGHELSSDTRKPLRMGYFGGSFDPPHRGHLAVARAARDRFHLERVLLAPTARQPLKPRGLEACWSDRLRMTELLCAGEPGLQASAIDGPMPDGEPNYTADTLRRLHEEFSSTFPGIALELFAIVGVDAFLGLRHWREPSALLQLAEWIVVSRPGFPLPNTDGLGFSPEQRRRIHPLQDVHERVSATELRLRLQSGEPCQDLVPAAVLQLIKAQGLYRSRLA